MRADGHPTDGRPAILVVEDDPGTRQLLATVFQGEGYAVVQAEDGGKGVEHLDDDVALVILDIAMPVLDGFGVLAELRRRPEKADLPVILLTARHDESDIWQAWALSGDYFVSKPFDLDRLVGLVHEVIERRVRVASR